MDPRDAIQKFMKQPLTVAVKLIEISQTAAKEGRYNVAMASSFVASTIAGRHYQKNKKLATEVISCAAAVQAHVVIKVLGREQAAALMMKRSMMHHSLMALPMSPVAMKFAKAVELLDRAQIQFEQGSKGDAIVNATAAKELASEADVQEKYPYKANQIVLQAEAILHATGFLVRGTTIFTEPMPELVEEEEEPYVREEPE